MLKAMSETRAALLDAAEICARTRGFDGFSYADLADAVGIRKASIHHHFPTKADLALALIERYCSRIYARQAEIAADKSSAGEKLRDFLSMGRAALGEGDRLCLCVVFCVGRDGLSDAVLKELDAYHQRTIEWLEGVFRLARKDGSIRGVEKPGAEAAACLAQMQGALLVARAANDPDLFEAAVQSMRIRII
jgi:TetR/AcrR family transcriptional repressor of nem operon